MCIYVCVLLFRVDSYFLYWNWIPETVGLILGCALIHKCIYNLPSENQGMWQDLNRSLYFVGYKDAVGRAGNNGAFVLVLHS